MVKRFLVTTALEETWRDDEPVLFLGEWCRLYSRKDRWSKMDAEVLPYHWDDRAKLYADYQYLREFYERLLVDLSSQLNQIHSVDHSLRYWRILIGPWLGCFTQMLFDRWTSIQSANSQYDLSGTIVLTGKEELLVPQDMPSFTSLALGDEWSHHLYSAILQQFTKVPCAEVSRENKENISIEVPVRIWKRNIKLALFSLYSRVANRLTRDQDAFFMSTYLNLYDELKLCQRFRQIPQFWRFVPTLRVAVDKNQRQWVVGSEIKSEFEICARQMIPQQIPTAYLEGYRQLLQQVAARPWPKAPKLIWTSNAHFGSDVFKAWAAEKIECGSPLLIGQHGGGYGVGRWCFYEDHEVAVSDCYLSWGWSDPGRPKIKPVGFLKRKQPLEFCRADQPGILLVTGVVNRYSYLLFSGLISRQQIDYFNDQYAFVECLPANIRKELTVRLYPHDFDWDQSTRWKDSFPGIRLNQGKSNMNDLMRQSRLCISTYNATTFLEWFSMNVPTVIFWNPNHWELRDSAIPYFEDLKSVGIFHETPESAARHVTAIWDDVDAWWASPAVQKVLECFKKQYCDMNNMLSRLETTLRSVVDEGKDLSPAAMKVEKAPLDML